MNLSITTWMLLTLWLRHHVKPGTDNYIDDEGWILREWMSSLFLDRLPNLMRITSNQIPYILHMLYRASPCYEHTAEWPALGGATVFDRTLKRTIPTCSSTKASQGCAGVSAQNKANLLSMYSRFVNLACVCVRLAVWEGFLRRRSPADISLVWTLFSSAPRGRITIHGCMGVLAHAPKTLRLSSIST